MINKFNEKVAVLLPTYNGEDFIEKQIKSIQNQLDVSLTLFIYDDDSEDNTFKKILNFKSVVVNEMNSLPDFGTKKSAANSFFRIIAGINLDPKYKYVAFSDQDDIWFSKKIKNGLDHIKNKSISGYSSSVLAYWSNGKNKYLKKSGGTSFLNSLFESAGPGNTYLITRELFDGLRSFILKNKKDFEKIDFHDWAIYSFALYKGYKWYIDPNPYLYYRQHNNNVFGARSNSIQYLKRINLIFNGWYASQVYLLHKIYFPKTYQKVFPGAKILYRFYIFFMVLTFRRRFVDKLLLSLLSLFSFININE